MRAENVTNTLDMALEASGCASASVKHRPRLLSDNGPSYIAEELAGYIEANDHMIGTPFGLHCNDLTFERWVFMPCAVDIEKKVAPSDSTPSRTGSVIASG